MDGCDLPIVTRRGRRGPCPGVRRMCEPPAHQHQYRRVAGPERARAHDRVVDEAVAVAVPVVHMIVCVVDATNLRLNLRLVLELRKTGVPLVLALNMADLAAKRGFTIDSAQLSAALGIPVVSTVAVRRGGTTALLDQLDASLEALGSTGAAGAPSAARSTWSEPSARDLRAYHREVDTILRAAGFRLTTEKFKTKVAADIVNNLATHGPRYIAEPYKRMYDDYRDTGLFKRETLAAIGQLVRTIPPGLLGQIRLAHRQQALDVLGLLG